MTANVARCRGPFVRHAASRRARSAATEQHEFVTLCARLRGPDARRGGPLVVRGGQQPRDPLDRRAAVSAATAPPSSAAATSSPPSASRAPPGCGPATARPPRRGAVAGGDEQQAQRPRAPRARGRPARARVRSRRPRGADQPLDLGLDGQREQLLLVAPARVERRLGQPAAAATRSIGVPCRPSAANARASAAVSSWARGRGRPPNPNRTVQIRPAGAKRSRHVRPAGGMSRATRHTVLAMDFSAPPPQPATPPRCSPRSCTSTSASWPGCCSARSAPTSARNSGFRFSQGPDGRRAAAVGGVLPRRARPARRPLRPAAASG